MDLEGRANLALRSSAAVMALCVLGTDLPHTLPPLAERAFCLLQPRRQLPRGFLKHKIVFHGGTDSAYGITELTDGSLVLSFFNKGARLVPKADRDKVNEGGVIFVDDNTPFPGPSTQTLYLPDVKVLINCSTNTKELVAYKVDFSKEEDGCSSGPPPRFSKLWALPTYKPVSVCRLGGTLSSSPFLVISSPVPKRLDVLKLDLQSLSTSPKEYPVDFGSTPYLRVSAIPGTESSLLFIRNASSIERMDIHINKGSGEISGCTIHPSPIASDDSFYGLCCIDHEWAMTSTGDALKRFRHYSLQGGVTTRETNEMSDIRRKARDLAAPGMSPLPKPLASSPARWAGTIIRAQVVFVSDVSGDTLIGVDGHFFVYE